MDNRSGENQISCIETMERFLDEQNELLAVVKEQLDKLELYEEHYRLLEAYYGSDSYMEDVEDSNSGLLPENLKCGVLSEDAVFDMFRERHEMALRMLDIARAMLTPGYL